MPGMPLQVICYERADDIGFGVSGVVTRARGIRSTFPDLDPAQIPMAAPVTNEKLVYLLDPVGASRRSRALRFADGLLRSVRRLRSWIITPSSCLILRDFCTRTMGLCFPSGNSTQWVGGQLMASGTVQIWPGMPVPSALIEDGKVSGVRLVDQGVDRDGNPDARLHAGNGYSRGALTVIGDGPVGAISRDLDNRLGMPAGNEVREWALGMKFVIELRPDVAASARNGDSHLWLPRTGDLRLPLCASGRRGVGGNLCAFVVRLSRADFVPVFAALHSAPVSVEISGRRQAAFVGCEVAAGIGQAR